MITEKSFFYLDLLYKFDILLEFGIVKVIVQRNILRM